MLKSEARTIILSVGGCRVVLGAKTKGREGEGIESGTNEIKVGTTQNNADITEIHCQHKFAGLGWQPCCSGTLEQKAGTTKI